MAENIEEILGTTIAEYTPNAIKFSGLSLETLQDILQQGYTTPTASFNRLQQWVHLSNSVRNAKKMGLQQCLMA
ncbi:hypothetical protein [[Phormidium ambiguum] IAM M-71]|uniref:hypothetical protein n=1 Tax=[Phormidium ambiguum] IAM M-71 TaxID=454136 RepID=UPI001C4A016C|nr:hypothetical protein [Phormidium ambiguum]